MALQNKNSESIKKAVKKYQNEKIDTITLRLPKGWKMQIDDFAKLNGYTSTTAFFKALIKDKIDIKD